MIMQEIEQGRDILKVSKLLMKRCASLRLGLGQLTKKMITSF